jgi:hypothetical protein
MITERIWPIYGLQAFFLCFYWYRAERATPISDHHQRVQTSGDHQGGVFPSPAISAHRSARSLLDAKGTAFCKDSPARRPGLHAPD